MAHSSMHEPGATDVGRSWAGRRRLAFAAVAVAILCAASVGFLELMARLCLRYVDARDEHRPFPESDLQIYWMRDPRNERNWILKPGFRLTLEQANKRAKQKAGDLYDLLQDAHGAVPPSQMWNTDVAFSVNSHGFKGPELDPTGSRTRVLALGDSCTFGSPLDYYSYPRTMERHLIERHHLDVEVVNGGVEGYRPENLLWRIQDFQCLRPHITILYIGWNSMYRPEPWFRDVHASRLSLYEFLSRVDRVIRKLFAGGGHELARQDYLREKRPNLHDPMIRALDHYVPESFIRAMTEVVQSMQSVGSLVYLTTLPGLYVSEEVLDSASLAKGHLPSFLDNPYLLARLTDRYNAAIWRVAASTGCRVIDLDAWSRKALKPRSEYFQDSVHLTLSGQEMLGQFVANWLCEHCFSTTSAQR